MFLFWDTKTTGVPRNYNAPANDFLNWPRLVQLAFVLCDDSGKIQMQRSVIVKPLGFVIPQGAIDVHGITQERALTEGVFLQEALLPFSWCAAICTDGVCHNFNFDSKIVGCEMLRCGFENPIPRLKPWCTMDETKEYVGIKNSYEFKFPQLRELYFKLFEKTFEGAHDALSDILATVECYWELRKRKLLRDR